MNDELEKVLIGTGSSAVTWLAVLARMFWRGRRRETVEEVMRKELWGEINTLRKVVSETMTTVIDWQAKYLSLLLKHENLSEELSRTQERLIKIAGLLSSALRALDRIDDVKLHMGENPNLLAAQQELQQMKVEATSIRQQGNALSQLSI